LASSPGRLWLAIGLHYGYNLGFSALGALFSTELLVSPLLAGYPGWMPETGLLGAAAFLALAAAYWQVAKN
jgi:hypothetical protein